MIKFNVFVNGDEENVNECDATIPAVFDSLFGEYIGDIHDLPVISVG